MLVMDEKARLTERVRVVTHARTPGHLTQLFRRDGLEDLLGELLLLVAALLLLLFVVGSLTLESAFARVDILLLAGLDLAALGRAVLGLVRAVDDGEQVAPDFAEALHLAVGEVGRVARLVLSGIIRDRHGCEASSQREARRQSGTEQRTVLWLVERRSKRSNDSVKGWTKEEVRDPQELETVKENKTIKSASWNPTAT